MNYLVIDVAAQIGGAVTILHQNIEEFKRDVGNTYIVVLSTLEYENAENVTFINYKWVKKSLFHRLWFDLFFIKRLIKKYKPDVILSLQNGAFFLNNIRQEVYFHNALPLSNIRYSIFQSKSIWLYQNIIGNYWKKSLQKAQRIYVQAEWISRKMQMDWGISPSVIKVKKPMINPMFSQRYLRQDDSLKLFYPANSSIYKNHNTLLLALMEIWDEYGNDEPQLILTCNESIFSDNTRERIKSHNYPISFVGQLTTEEMIMTYCKTALIFPSLIETIGLPLLEAKALGSIIFAADCEYAHDTLDSYEKAYYFDPKNKKCIKEVIYAYLKLRRNG